MTCKYDYSYSLQSKENRKFSFLQTWAASTRRGFYKDVFSLPRLNFPVALAFSHCASSALDFYSTISQQTQLSTYTEYESLGYLETLDSHNQKMPVNSNAPSLVE